VPAYGPQNDVTLKMPAFEWVHVQLHQQKGMISLSPPTICNSASAAGKIIGYIWQILCKDFESSRVLQTRFCRAQQAY
ncbi:hypothetical protein, partial [Shewanella sp. Shew256]|uniref:hypothetical protein n=1 Tax=Shewanella sp. Shew256 TaxID=1969376 RepID=UPI001C3C613A